MIAKGISKPVFNGDLVYKFKSKEEGKDQGLIQSSTTHDPGHHMGK